MQRHPLLKPGCILGIIVSCCAWFLSFFFMSNAESQDSLFFSYCAYFEFFISIICLVMAIIVLSKSSRKFDEVCKVYTILFIIFSFVLFLLQIGSLFVNDFERNLFEITFIFFTIIALILSLVFTLFSLSSHVNNGKYVTKQVQQLKQLLDNGIITQEEFEQKRQELVSRL